MAKLKSVIARLEKQHRELGKLLATLREIDGSGPIGVDNVGSLDSFEKRLIAGALERAGGSQAEAARILAVGRDKLRYKMRKHGLK